MMRQTARIDSAQDESPASDPLPARAPVKLAEPHAGDMLRPRHSGDTHLQASDDYRDALGHRSGPSTIDLVQTTWTEILNLETVGPDDDFFELGGNSLIVASAVARLGERLGIDLPPRALFEAPTPAEMAELIAERRADRERDPVDGISPVLPDWVVPLQREGGGRPVFVFPAGHDEMRVLTKDAQMAAFIGRHHPFWGFRRDHPYLEQARMNGVPAVAAEYVKQMRTIQPRGPFLLYASCAGGHLAWDAARQLLAAGEEIAGIFFYNVPLRPDFADSLPGHTPARITPPWSLGTYYRPQALPLDLTLGVTARWQAEGWSAPWQQVTRGAFTTVLIPSADPSGQGSVKREQRIGTSVREWIEKSEARVQGA